MENKQISKSQAARLIDLLYYALPYQRDLSTLYKTCLQQEKEHRKSPFKAGRAYGVSATSCAKYFTIKALHGALHAVKNDKELYSIADLLNIRYDFLLAQCIVMNNQNTFNEWFSMVESSDFILLDYSEMVK